MSHEYAHYQDVAECEAALAGLYARRGMLSQAAVHAARAVDSTHHDGLASVLSRFQPLNIISPGMDRGKQKKKKKQQHSRRKRQVSASPSSEKGDAASSRAEADDRDTPHHVCRGVCVSLSLCACVLTSSSPPPPPHTH
jgi:hypothetical protein